jgi:lipid-binding SYLF domain-containing protein
MTGAAIVGCDTSTPNSAAQQTALKDEAQASLTRMEAQDPTLTNQVNSAVGYAIFPEVGQAAIGIGGSSGKGVVYKNSQRVGRVTLGQGSIGPQIGGDTFAELIIFQDDKALNRLMNNSIELGVTGRPLL